MIRSPLLRGRGNAATSRVATHRRRAARAQRTPAGRSPSTVATWHTPTPRRGGHQPPLRRANGCERADGLHGRVVTVRLAGHRGVHPPMSSTGAPPAENRTHLGAGTPSPYGSGGRVWRDLGCWSSGLEERRAVPTSDHGARPRRRRRPNQDLVPFEGGKAWFLISLQTFGGPAGQIAFMHADAGGRAALGRRAAVSARSELLHALPGPEAQQLVTYLGWLLYRTAGGLVAGSCSFCRARW